MGQLIYLAYPIDNVEPSLRSALLSDVQLVRNHISGQMTTAIYEPGRAFFAPNIDPRIQAVNHAALMRADAMVALLPPNVSSVGVPMEIAFAVSMRIPALVYYPHFSQALQIPGVTQIDGMRELLDQIAMIQPIDRSAGPVIRYVPGADDQIALDPRPQRGYDGDAGFDLIYYGLDPVTVQPGEAVNLPAGVRIEWPPNTWGLVLGRSSTFYNRGLLVNPAVIDPGYRGDMFANVRNISLSPHTIQPGERLAQIVPLPALAGRMQLQRVDELSPSDRGDKGFGSTGK